MSNEYLEYLECPCCGNEGAQADEYGYFHEDQPLICGCDGCVDIDDDGEASITVFDDGDEEAD